MVFNVYMYVSNNLLDDAFYMAEELSFSARSYVECCKKIDRLNVMFRDVAYRKVFFTSVNLGDIFTAHGDLPDDCQLKILFDE